uniref:Uncharacterized protein n=1 Tax=Romanomermis culicivorax TaxID=13658 RepID=A0A915JRH9_ROMCU
MIRKDVHIGKCLSSPLPTEQGDYGLTNPSHTLPAESCCDPNVSNDQVVSSYTGDIGQAQGSNWFASRFSHFCDNLERELKIQDELFEQWLQKHHCLVINETKLLDQDTMDTVENTISTVSTTNNRPGYFHHLTSTEIMFFQKYYKTRPLEVEAKMVVVINNQQNDKSKVAMLVHKVMTSSNATASPHDKPSENVDNVDKVVAKSNLDSAQKEYVSQKENAFADFLSQKCDIDTQDNGKPSTSDPTSSGDSINIVEMRAKSKQKLAPQPQADMEVPKMPEDNKIIDPSDLLNQDLWPFMQQQIADAQKVDPTLDQPWQKVENQIKVV